MDSPAAKVDSATRYEHITLALRENGSCTFGHCDVSQHRLVINLSLHSTSTNQSSLGIFLSLQDGSLSVEVAPSDGASGASDYVNLREDELHISVDKYQIATSSDTNLQTLSSGSTMPARTPQHSPMI